MTITKKVSKVIISAIIFFALAGNAQTSRLSIDGRAQHVTDEFNLKVSGLKPNQKIVIQTHTKDQRDRLWISSASFISNKNGIISLNKQAPLEGFYSDVETEVGIEASSIWWKRNMHILKNITQIIEDDKDRILVIIGAAHRAILKDFIKD